MPIELYNGLIFSRRLALIYIYTSIAWDIKANAIYIYTDSGRMCHPVYYVNKKTKIVESWSYVSSPDKCSMGFSWFGPW